MIFTCADEFYPQESLLMASNALGGKCDLNYDLILCDCLAASSFIGNKSAPTIK